jgi:hypothetical protein
VKTANVNEMKKSKYRISVCEILISLKELNDFSPIV